MVRAEARRGPGPPPEGCPSFLLYGAGPKAPWEGMHEGLLPLALGLACSFLSLTILKGSPNPALSSSNLFNQGK